MEAVSALKIFSPRFIKIAPLFFKCWTSSLSKPPSGPTMYPIFLIFLFFPKILKIFDKKFSYFASPST